MVAIVSLVLVLVAGGAVVSVLQTIDGVAQETQMVLAAVDDPRWD